MANVNAPFGLRPVRYASGAPYNGACKMYFATGATGAIYKGDPVVASGTANTSAFGDFGPGMLPTCQIALDGDGDPITGVCVGVLPVTRDSTTYRADSTDRIILVADDPNLVFVGQCNAAGTAWAAVDIGQFGNMLVGTGSTATGMSGWTLDTTGSSVISTVSSQLHIERLFPAPDNELGAYARFEVTINNHTRANVTDAGRMTPT